MIDFRRNTGRKARRAWRRWLAGTATGASVGRGTLAGRFAVGCIAVACIAVACTVAAGLLAPARVAAQSQSEPEAATGPPTAGRTAVARHVMAVTANRHATAAALEILRAGGNALDAAAAAQFVLNVVEPQSSGIGGGGFLLYYRARSREVIAVDGREEAPAAVTPQLFLRADGTPEPFYPGRITGGRAVGVPGLLKALQKALRRHGRLSLERVLRPAIRLAAGGFAVSPRLAALLRRGAERLRQFPATRAIFFHPGGGPLRAGEILRQPDLAATFRLIAGEGAGVFYRGVLAQDIVRAVRGAPVNPGLMTRRDLAGYDAPFRAPVKGAYRGYTLYGMGPPSSGGVTLFQILHLLQAAPPLPAGAGAAARVHRFAQAARLAYADRARYLADPDFFAVPVVGLLAPSYARRRAAAHRWEAPLAPVEAGRPQGAGPGPPIGSGAPWHQPEGFSTTHLTVVDEARNVVVLTSSIEQAFGSGMVVPGRGFLLNNQLTDFSARPRDRGGREIANRVEGGRRPRRTALDGPNRSGGKRPRSSMAPTLVFKDGKPLLALGSPGGSLIIQFVAEALLRVLDGGMPLERALSAPHRTHLRGSTFLEPGAPAALVARLQKLGHKVRVRKQTSGLHAVRIEGAAGLLYGAADPRREGTAEGY